MYHFLQRHDYFPCYRNMHVGVPCESHKHFDCLMFIGPCIIVIAEEWKTNLMSLAILFHFLCVQHVSDINISIIRSLRLCCWFATSVVLFSVRCVSEFWCGWFWVVLLLQAEASAGNTQRTENKTTGVVNQQHSRKLLMMDILMSETCWAHKKWNKIASDIKLVFYSSTLKLFTSYYRCSTKSNLSSAPSYSCLYTLL